MIKALIKDGVCVNIIVVDPDNIPPLDVTLIDPIGVEIGSTWDGLKFTPPVRNLNVTKQQKLSELQSRYEKEMASGFTSSVLGQPYFYRTDDGRIQMMAAAVASGQTVKFMATLNGTTSLVTHTAVQMQQVLNAGRLVAEALAEKLLQKIALVQNAADVATVDSITW